MPFNWLEFYRLAGDLSSLTADEAAMRSAISRAYYTTYHLAEERRKNRNIPLPPASAGVHFRLWSLFKNHPQSGCRKVGIDGDRLRKRRKAADYDAVINNLPSETILAMQEAQKLIASIISLPANLP